MDAISVEQSVYLDGQWLDALWMVETVDGESGEMVITATVAGPGAPHVAALRMDMELVRQLRAGAGFVEARPEPEGWMMAEIREAVGEVMRGYGNELTEHWRRLELLTSDLDTLERRVDVLSGMMARFAQAIDVWESRLALAADDAAIRRTQALTQAMEESYDPEHDASRVTQWDVLLLSMVLDIEARLVALAAGGAS